MKHTASGAYDMPPTPAGLKYVPYEQGFLETRPEHIERQIDPDTVAFYHHTHLPDRVMFEKLRKIREKYGVKFMWEIMYMPGKTGFGSPYFNMDKMKNAINIAGMWSLNRNEAADIFSIPRENDEDIINELIKIEGSEMCYYRCGSKGAYVVTGNSAYFCPLIDITSSVDPMGCGNCSTGAAMYAWCETGDPLMTGIMRSSSTRERVSPCSRMLSSASRPFSAKITSYSFSRIFPQPWDRDLTCISCIGRWILHH